MKATKNKKRKKEKACDKFTAQKKFFQEQYSVKINGRIFHKDGGIKIGTWKNGTGFYGICMSRKYADEKNKEVAQGIDTEAQGVILFR